MLGRKCALFGVGIFASWVLSSLLFFTGCGGNSPSPSVSVTASATTVDGTDTVTVTATVTNDKNAAGVSWSMTGAGALSNETTTSATFTAPAATNSSQSATITVTSIADPSQTGTVTITIAAKPSITTAGTALNSTVGASFNVTLQVSGGVSPYTWSVDPLPSCLSLNPSTGAVTGTITAACAGNFTATFTVTDSGKPNPMTATEQLSFTITAATPLSLPATLSPATATVGTAYSGSVAASGGVSPLTYSITGGALPAGLNLNTATGAITGTPTTSGPASFTVAVGDNFGDTPASQGYALTVNAESQTITFANPGAQTVGTPLALSATASSNLAVSYASQTTGVCTVSGATATFIAIGTCTIQATQAGNSAYAAATPVSQTFTVNGEAQTITFANPGTQNVGTPLALTATASSGLPVSLASTTTGVCTVSGTTATFIAIGSCTIQATQAGNSTYAAATMVSQTFAVNGEAQTITFGTIPTQAIGTPLALVATASSGLTVSFASETTGVCTVAGTTASFIATGTCTIQATQAGNSTWAAATPVSQSFTVSAESQTITFNNPGAQAVGTPLTLSASASSGLTVSFNSQTASVCTVAGTTATFINSGTCTIQATQAGNSTYAAATPVSQSFTVNPGTQTITFNTIPTQTVGTPLPLTATASSGLAVSFNSQTAGVCTVAGTTATFINSGTCTIQATQAGNSAWSAAAPVSQSFTVNPGSQTITFNNPGTQNVGTPLTLAASASSGLAVSYNSQTTGVCTVSGTTASFIATGTCTIQATQAGNSAWAAASPVSQTFQVNGEVQTITFTNPGPQTIGTPVPPLVATSTSGLTVTFTSATTGVCTVSGTAVTLVSPGNCTIDANQAGNSTYAAAPQVADTFAVNGEPQTITFNNPGAQTVGTPLPLVATASSGLTVSFASQTTSVCTVAGTTASFIATGTCTIQATQAGNSTWAAATPVSQSFQVTGETQTITFNTISTQTVGTPLTLTATASSGLTVSYTSQTTSVCTVSGTNVAFINSGTCTIQATQTGNSTYSAATPVSQSFAVNPGNQTITFNNPGAQTVGTPLTLSATSTSGLAVTFTSQTTSICTVSGTTATFIASGTCTINADQAGNSAWNPALTVQQSFTVNSAGGTIAGQFSLQNSCSNGNGNLPVTFTVTINTTPNPTQVQTNSTGQFSFSSVPAGTYTITPSITGATSSLFYPASYTGVVISNGSNIQNQNFNAQVGFDFSGTVSYTGSQTGQTYVVLSGGCSSGNSSLGTTLSTKTGNGSYTIRGVQPGSYQLSAWMDPLGSEVTNAIDPTYGPGLGSPINASVTGVDITLTDPTFATPTENPTIQTIVPNSQGVTIFFNDSQNSNGVEDANQYVVQWSTSPTLGGGTGGGQFANIAGSHTFTAMGNKGAWILDNGTVGAGTFQSGTTYYFQARSFNTLDTANPHPSGWCDYNSSSGCSTATPPTFTGVAVGTPTCTGTCTTVSGSVTIPSGLKCPTNTSDAICPGAPLYLGLIQLSPSTGNPTHLYVTETASPVVGANDFTVTVPSGSNYAVIGILDQMKNGGFGAGAVSNTRQNLAANLTISGSSQNLSTVTLPSANSIANVTTQYNSYTCQNCGSTQTSYQLNFDVTEQNRLPVAVTLTSGPNVLNNAGTVAIDMTGCTDCGDGEFQYSATLAGGAPKLGDAYGFTVTYSDGTQDTGTAVSGAVTAFGSTTAVVGPSDLPTLTSPTVTASSDTPGFDWTDPSLTNPSNYYYDFYLNQQSGTCPNNNCNIWQIPNQNGKSNGFSNSITSLTWDVDPISGDDSLPSVTSLTSGDTYNWCITVNDSSNWPSNQADSCVYFVAP